MTTRRFIFGSEAIEYFREMDRVPVWSKIHEFTESGYADAKRFRELRMQHDTHIEITHEKRWRILWSKDVHQGDPYDMSKRHKIHVQLSWFIPQRGYSKDLIAQIKDMPVGDLLALTNKGVSIKRVV